MCPHFYWEVPMAQMRDLLLGLVWSDGWSLEWLALPSVLLSTGGSAVGAIALSAATIAALMMKAGFKRRR